MPAMGPIRPARAISLDFLYPRGLDKETDAPLNMLKINGLASNSLSSPNFSAGRADAVEAPLRVGIHLPRAMENDRLIHLNLF